MRRILIVEDDAENNQMLKEYLEDHGYACTQAYSGSEARLLFTVEEYDLVLLDLNLPVNSGFQICREIKQKSSIPVLVLTSRDQLQDELHALNLGADEYLIKPCRKERLLARVSNVLKRYEGRQNLLEGPECLLDRQTYTLYIHNSSVVLPRNQGKILEMFLLHGEEAVSKEELCMAIWGTTEFIDENALQVNLTRLKKTLAGLKMRRQIVLVRGLGYRFTEEEPHEA